ncbi:pyridoxal 5'-phosphate synthase glutaminase subunit PdxT [Microbacterium aquilitoris]|uniref:pyridoxal 5'-phosphate synthase glutaminase subunit PdxT n=1 Tax=Microbacterium aquilitoris TaxID=3067307 RepID=UPI00288E8E9A|nr:pyridoxal 5'-phosphate synthase glutaminase subunit PdxT [Microbacterium sp. KSW2-22]MDT3343900.1 pyridoxal 5'-phosphate synthase glutaminase subunit PdxT [Microbacterium sp. KSW2-22]
MTRPRIGVLALQGDVREHSRVLTDLGADVVSVRRPGDLAAVSALVLPGGESSVIDKLSRAFGMREPLRAAIAGGMPVLGTCAGLILLADRLEDGIVGQQTFGGLDVTVRRNAFGSQTESFETDLEVPAVGDPRVKATFIRAPIVSEVGPSAEVIARLPDGGVVAVRQGGVMGLSFHPELDGERRFHELLLDAARDA